MMGGDKKQMKWLIYIRLAHHKSCKWDLGLEKEDAWKDS